MVLVVGGNVEVQSLQVDSHFAWIFVTCLVWVSPCDIDLFVLMRKSLYKV
jgi:hypothetical protein